MVAIDPAQVQRLRDLLGGYLRQYGLPAAAPQFPIAEGALPEQPATAAAAVGNSEDSANSGSLDSSDHSNRWGNAGNLVDSGNLGDSDRLDSPAHSNSLEKADSLAAISGAIVTWQARFQTLQARGLALEAWVQAVLTDFDPQAALAATVDAAIAQTQQGVITQIHQWRQALRQQVLDTLSAYVQDHAPDFALEALRPTVLTLVPMVADGNLTRAETEAIVAHVQAQFDLPTLLNRMVDAPWRAIAAQVAQYLENAPVERALQETVHAYIQTHGSNLVDIGEDLIEWLLAQVLQKRGEFNLDVDVDPETARLVVRQVSFKLHWLEASPPPSKTALEIAQQVETEVADFNRHRHHPDTFPTVYRREETTSDRSVLGGALEVGITLQPETVPSPGTTGGNDEGQDGAESG